MKQPQAGQIANRPLHPIVFGELQSPGRDLPHPLRNDQMALMSDENKRQNDLLIAEILRLGRRGAPGGHPH